MLSFHTILKNFQYWKWLVTVNPISTLLYVNKVLMNHSFRNVKYSLLHALFWYAATNNCIGIEHHRISLHLLPSLHHRPGTRRRGVQLPALKLLQEAEQCCRLADPGNIKYNYIWLIITNHLCLVTCWTRYRKPGPLCRAPPRWWSCSWSGTGGTHTPASPACSACI